MIGLFSRRSFIRRSTELSVLGAGGSFAMSLTGAAHAAESSQGSYRALVCLFMDGGNDSANTLIPYDPWNYNRYADIRRDIALPRSSLANSVLQPRAEQTLTDDLVYSLAPTMPKLRARFDQGKLAVLLNVGPQLAPLTKAQYESSNHKAYPRPAKLFSHNDQQTAWHTGGDNSSTAGWGGKVGDLIRSNNTNAMFTGISTSGNTVFLTGENVIPYQISGDGPLTVRAIDSGVIYGSRDISDSLREILTNHHMHALEQDYATVMARSLQFAPFVKEQLSGGRSSAPFGTSRLDEQLELVTRLIRSRRELGVNRQVFFVQLGGFDHHTSFSGAHAGLLGVVDNALDAFYQTMQELGVADQVTTFTASDFGRTLTSNGDGTDHGWGGHHFILGDSVLGGQFYGTAPHVSITSDDQVGSGRLLPTTSVDEYASTLGRWLGVASSDIPYISPNIARFANPDLGFMRN